jgi:hypothetical protein
MGWRFRKSFKILPGVRMNVGPKGVTSWSFGGRGARINVGKRGTTTTYNLFGTGLTYRTHTPSQSTRPRIAVTPVRQAVVTTPSAPPFPGRRSPVGTYAVVGMAALGAYLVLKPESPTDRRPSGPAPTAYQAPEVRRSSPPPLPGTASTAAASTPGTSAPAATLASAVPGEAVTRTGANVRSSASMSGSIVRVLDAGARVRVLGQEGGWRRVAGPEGEAWGWVHGSILRQGVAP